MCVKSLYVVIPPMLITDGTSVPPMKITLLTKEVTFGEFLKNPFDFSMPDPTSATLNQ